LPAIVGEVIHRSLDLILRTFYEHGCSSINDAAATEALRGLGGYSAIVDREIARQVEALQANPRMVARVSILRTTLRSRLPEIRQRTQTMVSRAKLVPTTVNVGSQRLGTGEVTPLRKGSHPEVSLRVPDLRLTGRADLLTLEDSSCAIVDYKTGLPNDHHAEQVRMYQLLWSRDTGRNPGGVPVTSLTLSYARNEVSVEPLSSDELAALADDLTRRVDAAEEEVGHRPPPARPAPEVCRLCAVRHLCTEYWVSSGLSDAGGEYVDRQGIVSARQGPKSWLFSAERPLGEQVILRTPTEQPGFEVGDEIRLLDVVLPQADDEDGAVITMTPSSEFFVVESAG
jgi:hypothetical protein